MKWDFWYIFALILYITVPCLPIVIFGCASKPIELAYNCPVITLPVEPVWSTKSLTTNSSPNLVVQTLVADDIKGRGWIKTVYEEIKAVDKAEDFSSKPK